MKTKTSKPSAASVETAPFGRLQVISRKVHPLSLASPNEMAELRVFPASPLDPIDASIFSAFQAMTPDQKLWFLEIARGKLKAQEYRQRRSGFKLIAGTGVPTCCD